MAINKTDFKGIIDYYYRNNDQEGCCQFLMDAGLSKDLVQWLFADYWRGQRVRLGATLHSVLQMRNMLGCLDFKKVQITYRIVESDTPYAFQKPDNTEKTS